MHISFIISICVFGIFHKYITISATVNKHCCSGKFELFFASSSSGAVLLVAFYFVYPKFHQHNDCTIVQTTPNSLDYSTLKQIIYDSNAHPRMPLSSSNHVKITQNHPVYASVSKLLLMSRYLYQHSKTLTSISQVQHSTKDSRFV